MSTSCVEHSDTPKYVVHVLGGAVSKKYRQQHYYYDMPKYIVDILEGAVSKTDRRLPESINHRHVILISSRAQVVTEEAA